MNINLLDKAITVAVQAHAGQVDKAGKPYIMHLIRVMMKGETETEKVCGILHDIVEDTNCTFDTLKKEGFTNEVIDVVRCVTKIDNETYDDFISRILENPTAIKVKINDLEDNMNLDRLNEITSKDTQRLEKYNKALMRLLK
jgi:(p)ppGpp synthase/HD superfamily hydrolase